MLQQEHLEDRVEQYYLDKGYDVHKNVRVRGHSGAIHSVPMVIKSDYGHMVVAFPDASGFDGPEMNSIRHVARDVGATPVFAADDPPGQARQMATKLGIVLLDGLTLTDDEEPTLDMVGGPSVDLSEETVGWPRSRQADAMRRGESTIPWPSATPSDDMAPNLERVQSDGNVFRVHDDADEAPEPAAKPFSWLEDPAEAPAPEPEPLVVHKSAMPKMPESLQAEFQAAAPTPRPERRSTPIVPEPRAPEARSRPERRHEESKMEERTVHQVTERRRFMTWNQVAQAGLAGAIGALVLFLLLAVFL